MYEFLEVVCFIFLWGFVGFMFLYAEINPEAKKNNLTFRKAVPAEGIFLCTIQGPLTVVLFFCSRVVIPAALKIRARGYIIPTPANQAAGLMKAITDNEL